MDPQAPEHKGEDQLGYEQGLDDRHLANVKS